MDTILIKNGLIIDGTKDSSIKPANVLIKGQKIALITAEALSADTVIDAKGMIVCPGFIDTHTHSEFTLLADPRAEGRIAQGVTTEINGNCGLSSAPLFGEAASRRQEDLKQYDIKERWQDFDEYFELLRHRKIAINFATLCGHGNLRGSVIGYTDKPATPAQISEMKNLLYKALSSGVKGLSTGLIYPPGIYASTDEIVELASVLKPFSAVYATHMRSESDFLLEAIEETLQIGLHSGASVHISHLKTGGRQNWHKKDAVIKLLQTHIDKGLKITADRYPYIASSTDLDTLLPKWAFEGGYEDEIKRLKDPTTKAKILEHLNKEDPLLWDEVLISQTVVAHNSWMQGKTLAQIASKLNKHPKEALIDILIDEGARTGAIFFSMCEENLIEFLKLPFLTIGSDSAVRCFYGITAQGLPHPRGFGSFARVLGKYVREQKILTLTEAIYKMTGLPAKIFSLLDRGILKEGYYADIVIFDPERVTDTADFLNPFAKPIGIDTVIVNGVIAYRAGEFSSTRAGMII